MHIKSIVSAAAIALAATIGTASAADQFTTLDGVQAQPMIAAEMDLVKGAVVDLSNLVDRSALTVGFTDDLVTLTDVCGAFCDVMPTPPAGP